MGEPCVDRCGKILVVDDRAPVREMLRDHLAGLGFGVSEASDGVEALDALKRARIDLVVSDLRMPRLDGLGLLQRLRIDGPPVVVVSAYGDVQTAVEVMRAGAVDFVALPMEPGELARKIARHVGPAPPDAARPSTLVGEHPSMIELSERIDRVAPREVAVLITGESGVGKELVARELHRRSRRAHGPFVAVNCCALTDSLLESELFGHERGAFTGAATRKVGRFERADGGTLFLDEIGDAPAATQAKLLRVLQEKEVERVGGFQPIAVDVRVLAATNRDLAAMRRRGEFRNDLFHRLNVFPLRVPPLRERLSDLPLLLESICARRGVELRLTAASLERLRAHTWPGNVRELENAVERLAVLRGHGGAVTLDRVELAFDEGAAAGAAKREIFEEAEGARYEELLARHRWNVSAVARELGISRGALRHRMRKYGLA